MYTLLRWMVEWHARRRGAQVIVFDGGAEVERSRAFLRGVLVGGAVVLVAGIVAAPLAFDPVLMREAERREALLREAESRARDATEVTGVCLAAVQTLQRTLDGYREMVETYPGVARRR